MPWELQPLALAVGIEAIRHGPPQRYQRPPTGTHPPDRPTSKSPNQLLHKLHFKSPSHFHSVGTKTDSANSSHPICNSLKTDQLCPIRLYSLLYLAIPICQYPSIQFAPSKSHTPFIHEKPMKNTLDFLPSNLPPPHCYPIQPTDTWWTN